MEVLRAITVSAGSAPVEHTSSLLTDLRAGLKGLRIGLVRHFHEEDSTADARIVAGLDAAVSILRELGAAIDDVRLSPLSVWANCGRTIQQAEQYVVHEQWLRGRPQDYCEASRSRLIAGASLTASDYIRALQTRRVLCEEFADVMRCFDAVVTLSSFEFPCPLDDEAAMSRTYMRHARMPFNVTGTPAMALPVGFADNGMPLGIQVASKAFDEAMLYRIGWAYEDATRRVERRPELPPPEHATHPPRSSRTSPLMPRPIILRTGRGSGDVGQSLHDASG